MFGSLGQIFSRAFETPYLKSLLGWITKLQENALIRWTPVAIQNISCWYSGYGCPSPAISICEICRFPTCLEHALVAHNADVVCLRCVNSIYTKMPKQPAEPPRPRPQAVPDPTPSIAQIRRAHFKTLHLRESATLDQVKTRYKRLVLKVHPDRGGSASEFNRITKAYEWITKVHFAQ